MSEFLRPVPTTTPGIKVSLAAEFPGAIEEQVRLWKLYASHPRAKDLVGRDFQKWKRDHGYPSDLDER